MAPGTGETAEREGDANNETILRVRPLDVLAFALMVQSVSVDRQLKYDMQVMCHARAAMRQSLPVLFLHPLARRGIATCLQHLRRLQVADHVFSLDPIVDQQNQLDLFSQRTELQLALATAVATGQASFQNATTYARRLEQDSRRSS